MADFNFTVQDLMSNDPTPFVRENTKDLINGKALVTSGSFGQTQTFNPTVGSSVLSIGEMMMGPTVFLSQSTSLQSSSATLQQLVTSSDSPGTATGSTTTSSGTSSGTGAPAQISSNSNVAAKIAVVVQTAQSQLGVPYQWGGGNDNGPTLGSADSSNGGHLVLGFDCSGLALFCYDKAGLQLPRVAQDQYNATPHVDPTGTLLAGDLVFFGTDTSNIGHVGICIGNNNMIDAPQTGSVVRVENYHWSDLVGASRPFS